MKKLIAAGALMAGMLTSAHASAAEFVFTMTGNISYIGHSQNIGNTSTPLDLKTDLNVGDKVIVKATFDTSSYVVTSLYDADPAINIYYGRWTSLSYEIGSYSYSATNIFSTIQTWNNYFVNDYSPNSDSWSGSGFIDTDGFRNPVDLGPGQTGLHFQYYAFDRSGTQRTSDLLDEQLNLAAFSQSGSMGYYNSSLGRHSTYLLSEVSATLEQVGAVPEPATWMLMLSGMALTGYALRRRRATVRMA